MIIETSLNSFYLPFSSEAKTKTKKHVKTVTFYSEQEALNWQNFNSNIGF